MIRSSMGFALFRKVLYLLIILFCVLYGGLFVYRAFSASFFRRSTHRINLLFYGNQTVFYSLDRTNTRQYLMYFYPDLKLQVPGGYGNYRVGSLGKLAKLDKNRDLLKKTFSLATTSFIDYTFDDQDGNVFYGKNVPKQLIKPSIRTILFSHSDAPVLDRLYLALFILTLQDDEFHQITYETRLNKVHEDVFFESTSFVKDSIGLLYQSEFRLEGKNIQINYQTHYLTAYRIGTILEGNGIRVNDISEKKTIGQSCIVTENSNSHSISAMRIASFFDCQLEKGETDVYDIVFSLNTLEKSWAMK